MVVIHEVVDVMVVDAIVVDVMVVGVVADVRVSP